ncbi:MAG: 30S ribosomal protein S25e [Desulfurococcaceae archaeon]
MSTRRKTDKPISEETGPDVSLYMTIKVEDILKKIQSEVSRKAVKYYTPYTLAQAYGIKVSFAKRVLREAVKRGILELYSPGRRSPVFVPRQSR